MVRGGGAASSRRGGGSGRMCTSSFESGLSESKDISRRPNEGGVVLYFRCGCWEVVLRESRSVGDALLGEWLGMWWWALKGGMACWGVNCVGARCKIEWYLVNVDSFSCQAPLIRTLGSVIYVW